MSDEGIFPRIIELELPYSYEENAAIQGLGTDFAYDFKKGDFILENGQPKKINGKAAIAVWIEKVMRTQIYRWPIYETLPYGTNIEDLVIGKYFPIAVVKSELIRELTEAITKHPEISYLDTWEFQYDEDSEFLNVEFTVHLENEESFKKEVLMVGKIL